MKYFLLIVFIVFISCKKPKEVNKERSLLHGKWESFIIRSKEPSPPKRIILELTAYNKTKLTYLKMTAYGSEGQSYERTIRISLDKKGYIVPSIKKELKTSPKTFIWYNPKHKDEIKGLEWKYIVTQNELTIEMGTSKIMFRRIKN